MTRTGRVLALILVLPGCGGESGTEAQEDPRGGDAPWFDMHRAQVFAELESTYAHDDGPTPCEYAAAWEQWLASHSPPLAFFYDSPAGDEAASFQELCETYLTDEQAACVAHENHRERIECCFAATPLRRDASYVWTAEECAAGKRLD